MIEKREILPRIPLYYSVPMLIICIVALFILISLFRIEYPILLLQPAPSNAINVSSCGILSQNDSYYIINQSFPVNSSNCIIINANHVVLDGEYKYILKGNTSFGPVTPNIISINGHNVNVKRMNLTSGKGGIISNNNYTAISENYLSNFTDYAIKVNYGMDSKVSRNIVHNSTIGIFLDSYNNTKIDDNHMYSVNTSIYLIRSSHNTISDNILEDPDLGLLSTNSYNNSFSYFNISRPYRSAILVSNQEFTTSPIFDSFTNVNVLNPRNSAFSSLQLSSLVVNDFRLTLVNNTFPSYSFSGINLTLIGGQNTTQIKFLQPITTFGYNLTDVVKTEFNFAEVRSDLNPDLNKSAIITFFGLPTSIDNATVYRDGFVCPVSYCANATVSVNSGISNLTVNGWTNYSLNYIGQGSGGGGGGFTFNLYEPDNNQEYFQSEFPITFNIGIIFGNSTGNYPYNGTVKFSLNNGSTNTTMNPNGFNFTYSQSQLALGNYTFTIYANSSLFNLSYSTNFSVVSDSTVAQFIDINEPDENDQYSYGTSFPVSFDVDLNYNGSVKFNLNNGANITMNTTDNRSFTYSQPQLALGNYTFRAYATFFNGTKINDSVKFSVVNTSGTTTGTGSGSNSGSSSGSSSGSTGGTSGGNNRTLAPFNSTKSLNNSDGAQTLNSTSSNSESALRNMIYWLLIAVISIMIVILGILVFRAIKDRKKASLGPSFSIVKTPFSNGLTSNLR